MKRILQIDALRFIAILAIVICHLYAFIPFIEQSSILMYFESVITWIGLTLFFFLSGYSLLLKRPRFQNGKDFKDFYFKRFVRIFPLYWFALFILIILQSLYVGSTPFIEFPTNPFDIAITILAMQTFLTPTFASTQIFWFVGAIVLFYILFPIIIFLSDKMRSDSIALVKVSLVLIVFLVIIKILFDIIDDRIFFYYSFFIAGIVVGQSQKLFEIESRKLRILFVLSTLLFFALEIARLGIQILTGVHLFSQTGIVLFISNMIFINVIGAFGIITSLVLVNLYSKNDNRFSNWIVESVGRSTLSIYLFHFAILIIISRMISTVSPLISAGIIFIVGIPLAMLAPIPIQYGVDGAVDRIRKILQ